MKIGFISQPWDNAGPPDPGGSIGLLIWEVARRLARNHRVMICGPRLKGHPATEQWDGVSYARFSLAIDRRILEPVRQVWGLSGQRPDFASNFYYAAYAIRAARALHAFGCDVVHVHNFSQFIPLVRRFHPEAKVVLHMHCDWLVQLNRRLIHQRLRSADAIIGCCEYITGNVRRSFPEYADRCTTVHNGADIGEFLPRAGRTESSAGARVLYVGRVSPEKGLHVLLDAFERVVAVRPEARLEIIGGEYLPPIGFIVGISANPEIRALSRFYGNSYLQYLRDRVRAELQGRVSFAGSLAHHEVAERLRKADIFVQPSVWSEPFPLSVVEAMATGLPVVASRAGGLPEAVTDNETGLLVESGDPAGLAQALLKLIDDPALARNMGNSGCSRARQMFSWDTVAGTLSRRYEALCPE
jgi:glycosyltransferase involved in cell wall biosynthesis